MKLVHTAAWKENTSVHDAAAFTSLKYLFLVISLASDLTLSYLTRLFSIMSIFNFVSPFCACIVVILMERWLPKEPHRSKVTENKSQGVCRNEM